MRPESARDAVPELICEIVAGLGAGHDDVGPDTRLDVLGLDSLDLVELALILEDDYGFHVPAEAFGDAAAVTVSDIIALVMPEI